MVDPAQSVEPFAASIDAIVHGTTVTTNATLTGTGAKSALLTTEGVRDALEMRRGIREEQYNNAYTNVRPLVPRYLRIGVPGRLDRAGRELTPLSLPDVRRALELFRAEGVQAVSICFMNSFANPAHERAAAALVRDVMPDAYLTVSSDLLPAIRFYDRLSTTALNSYVGPKLNHYLEQLVNRLRGIDFGGLLLIMQSNGGVISPEIARRSAALTLLSGPAGGPGAGLFYAQALGLDKAITTDMGGTSFEASVAVGAPILVNDGEIARHRIALPMLDIHTIGAGGGSIGWIDPGGLAADGAAERGRRPGSGLLHEGRHAARRHRRQPGAGLPRPRLLRRRPDDAVARPRRARRSRRTSRGPWDSRSRRRRPACIAWSATTWRRECAKSPSSAATTRASSRSSPPAARVPSIPA